MNPMMRSLAAVLVVLALSGVAFGEGDQTYRLQTSLGPWGDNVLVTCVLTRDQTLEKLFSNNVLVSQLVAQWKANFEATPVAARKAAEIKTTLDALVQAIAADASINWTAQDLLVRKWAELPGTESGKQQIRSAFATLKADGLTCLSFMNRAETDPAPQALVTAMMNILANPRLSALTHESLYGTNASAEYSDTDMDLLLYAINDVRLIRTDPPNAVQAKGVSHCCDRVTRTCASSTGGCCTTCGTKCCLGATWCP